MDTSPPATVYSRCTAHCIRITDISCICIQRSTPKDFYLFWQWKIFSPLIASWASLKLFQMSCFYIFGYMLEGRAAYSGHILAPIKVISILFCRCGTVNPIYKSSYARESYLLKKKKSVQPKYFYQDFIKFQLNITNGLCCQSKTKHT